MSIAKATVEVSGAIASPREDRSAAAMAVSNALATSEAMATSDAKDRALYRVAGAAAVLALAALMVGGVAMALTSAAGTSTAGVLAAIGTNPWPFLAGGIGLVLVSLFDLFTIPALHATLGRYGRVLIVLASAAAVIGDLLGVIGRLAQTAMVPIGLQATPGPGPAGTELLAAGHVLGVLDFTINTAGFVLVSVSFTCFGMLMLRGFSRNIGWIAILAGVFTLLGQIPLLAPLFMVANAAYIAWYVGIGRRFWRMARLDG
jgi:Domain of unknown function (DUF4386)